MGASDQSFGSQGQASRDKVDTIRTKALSKWKAKIDLRTMKMGQLDWNSRRENYTKVWNDNFCLFVWQFLDQS